MILEELPAKLGLQESPARVTRAGKSANSFWQIRRTLSLLHSGNSAELPKRNYVFANPPARMTRARDPCNEKGHAHETPLHAIKRSMDVHGSPTLSLQNTLARRPRGLAVRGGRRRDAATGERVGPPRGCATSRVAHRRWATTERQAGLADLFSVAQEDEWSGRMRTRTT